MRSRSIGLVTWKVELQTLRTFFGYCIRHKWITFNPANDLKAPRNLKPNAVVPYSLREESLILAACEQIGGGKYNRSGAGYEQLRARAMIMLLRATALRISDVATFRKGAVSRDQAARTWRLVGTNPEVRRVCLPADSRKPKDGSGCASFTAERRAGLPLFLLERPNFAARCHWDRRTDPSGGFQEVGRKGRSCPPVSPHLGNATPRAGHHL